MSCHRAARHGNGQAAMQPDAAGRAKRKTAFARPREGRRARRVVCLNAPLAHPEYPAPPSPRQRGGLPFDLRLVAIRGGDAMKTQLLAWCQFPEPQGTAYSERDLCDPKKAAELLDRAQVHRAWIAREGWQALWRIYGLE